MTAPIHLSRGLPAWTLRLAAASACAAAAWVLAANGVQGIALGLFAVIVLAAVGVPASAAPALVIGFAALALVFTGGDPLRPSILVMIVLLHFVHLTCALAAVLPPGSRLHPSALAQPAKRFAITQLLVFALAGVIAVLPTGGKIVPVEVVGLFCGVGLVVAAVVVLRARS
jgi:hypothetical protein